MRIYEIIKETIEPIAPVASVTATAAQEPSKVQIATALKKVAGNTPVGPTGNPGVDNLLFTVGALSKKVGGIANAVGRGLNAIGGAFANNTSLQRTKFATGARRGAEITRGIPRNPEDTQKISKGQQQATGINRVPMAQVDSDDLIKLFTDAAAGKPCNPTGNPGIDGLLERAKLIKTPAQSTAAAPVGANIDQDIAG